MKNSELIKYILGTEQFFFSFLLFMNIISLSISYYIFWKIGSNFIYLTISFMLSFFVHLYFLFKILFNFYNNFKMGFINMKPLNNDNIFKTTSMLLAYIAIFLVLCSFIFSVASIFLYYDNYISIFFGLLIQPVSLFFILNNILNEDIDRYETINKNIINIKHNILSSHNLSSDVKLLDIFMVKNGSDFKFYFNNGVILNMYSYKKEVDYKNKKYNYSQFIEYKKINSLNITDFTDDDFDVLSMLSI